MFPKAPAFGSLRLATPDDILRIGIVATAGFRYSPLFRWERPYHKDFPQDTILSYRSQFANAIKSEDYIVLVAEGEYVSDENSKTEAIIPPDNGWTPPKQGQPVVVGVASIKLEPNSARKGQFRCDDDLPKLPPNEERDLNRAHYDGWGEESGNCKRRIFQGFSSMDMLVVHPAYWSKGHGTELVRWGMKLSDYDRVCQGVSAADMGARLYQKLGYEEVCKCSLDGDKDDPEGVSTIMFKYTPNL